MRSRKKTGEIMIKKTKYKISLWKVAFSTVTIFSLAGCAASIRSEGISEDINSRADTSIDQHYKQLPSQQNRSSFNVKDSSFFAQKPLNVISGDEQEELPPVLKKDVVMNMPQQAKLRDVLARITQLTGVFFSINNDVYSASTNEGSGFGSESGAFPGPPSDDGNGPAIPNSGGGSSGGNNSNFVTVDSLVYDGKLYSMLDLIAGKLNISWKWVGNKVEFYALDTKTYNVVALPGTTTTNATIDATSTTGQSQGGQVQTGSGQQGNSGNTTTLSAQTDVWQELRDTLNSVVSSYGKINYIPSAGKVTVTDSPNKLRVVGRVIEDFNDTFSKQVVVNVEVLSVRLNEQDNYGTSLNAMVNQLGDQYNINYNGQGVQEGNLLNVIFEDAGSDFDGSQAIISALSSIGDTSVVTNASLMTLNGQPVPLQVTREIAYAASTSTALNESTAVSQIQPGIVQEGFTINLTPRITNSKQVILQYSLDLSELIELRTFGTEDNQIQLPTRNVRNFLQRSSLQSGETLMLAGFKQLSASQNKEGALSPRLWPFGGQKSAENQNTQLVVLITPYVVN